MTSVPPAGRPAAAPSDAAPSAAAPPAAASSISPLVAAPPAAGSQTAASSTTPLVAAPPAAGSQTAVAQVRALPAAVRLARHLSVLPLGGGARVVGLDPDTALVVDGLPPPVAALIDRLDRAVVTHELVAAAAAHGVPADVTQDLLGQLIEAGALVDAARSERAARARAGGVVSVRGRGPLAVGIVTGLLHSGIGTVHTDTGGVVHGADLGTGYADTDRGGERLAATQAAVRRLLPDAVTRAPPLRSRPDLVVLADETPDPATVDGLRASGVAHLAVRLRDGVGIVGPLVYPGRTACLGCLDRTRSDLDPRWPAVAAQLAGRAGIADPAAVTATGGLAVAQAVAAIENGHPATLGATLELDVGNGSLRRRLWTTHPECPCGACGPVDRASPSGGETIMR